MGIIIASTSLVIVRFNFLEYIDASCFPNSSAIEKAYGHRSLEVHPLLFQERERQRLGGEERWL